MTDEMILARKVPTDEMLDKAYDISSKNVCCDIYNAMTIDAQTVQEVDLDFELKKFKQLQYHESAEEFMKYLKKQGKIYNVKGK